MRSSTPDIVPQPLSASPGLLEREGCFYSSLLCIHSFGPSFSWCRTVISGHCSLVLARSSCLIACILLNFGTRSPVDEAVPIGRVLGSSFFLLILCTTTDYLDCRLCSSWLFCIERKQYWNSKYLLGICCSLLFDTSMRSHYLIRN